MHLSQHVAVKDFCEPLYLGFAKPSNSTHLTNPAADYGSYGYGEPYQGADFTGYGGYGYDQSQFMAGGAG